ncbi:MAG: 1-deoxy-D-xylulose-5-phosphate reductoisomerase [Planctomycetota bacterium]|nr:1-deoxy-D-xylulose-5-phosphate reductoisomerase [Planctomycetota bacterium]
MSKRVLVLGSTGSIGQQTLQLVRDDREGLSAVGLAARGSWEAVREQVAEFRPEIVSLDDPEAARALEPHLPPGTRLLCGAGASTRIVDEVDFDVAIHGIVGAAGLAPSAAVLRRGRDLGLANKESMVIAGELLIGLAEASGARILPVDSEHSAVFQCLRGEDVARVRRVHLTASGGPFRGATEAELAAASPERALAHPNWDMGPRVTIGSATLMNKALEVIELHHLFGLDAERIHVVVHPQSIVHSMVEFVDGSVMAQLGPPDMRGPIHHALHHPDRGETSLEGFSFALFRELTFEEPDRARFPALDLGFRCVREGGTAGAVLNAADEVAVAGFLEGRIGLADIPGLCCAALDARGETPEAQDASSLEGLLSADAWARAFTSEMLGAHDSSRDEPSAPLAPEQ